MRTGTLLRLAGRALGRNRMRSFLTTLGVVIGVAAVIAMTAIGEGAKYRVQQTFESMGTNLLIVLSGSSATGGMQGGFGTQPTLTWEDLRAIQTELSAVKLAAPVLRVAAVVQAEDQNWTTPAVGTTPEYFRIRNWSVSAGQPMTAEDVGAGAKVVLLGQTVVEKLYGPGSNPVGRTVRIKMVPFQVIGVLARKGQSPMGQDYDDAAFVPVTTFQAKVQGGLTKFLPGAIFVSAVSADATGRAQQQIAGLLRDRHRLAPGTDDDFSVRNLSEIASAQAQGTQVLTTLLASIAAVSLLVGGIGIMNIMLVSVTERTREIGIRMAVGGKPGDILAQFVSEALALSAGGGLIGVAVGIGAALLLAHEFQWPTIIRAGTVVVSLGFSALVGVVFGLYPARKASRLDPIDALRFE
ncbi:MAG TPA: ABC transporter permease [Myxococcaceae bacterium]|nr:ABC transporter permease [Myxococcaceae bacterium]